jgi:hypothetical protein
MWRNHGYVALALLLTAVVFWAQILLFGDGLNNQVLNHYTPKSAHATDHVERAQELAGGGGFSEAFGDGRRMPGYPVFLSWFVGAFQHPFLVARFVQVFLASLIVAFAFLTMCDLFKSQGWALLGAVAFALWFPFYVHSLALSPETLSLFFFALFCYLLARPQLVDSRMHLPSMMVLAVLVYLNPVLALLFVPFAAVLEYRRGGGGTGVTIMGPLVVLVVLILPWTIWVSVKNDTFIPLTTSTGYNLYAGTGVTSRVDTTSATWKTPDMPRASVETLQLADAGLVAAVQRDTVGVSPAGQNLAYARTALGVWTKRPGKTTSYGVSKVLHAFGFSFRHTRDTLMVVQLVLSMFVSAFLWRRRLHREWCVFFWVVAATAALEAFLFVPSQRFKSVIFDLPALLIVVLGLVEWMRGTAAATAPEYHRK